MEDYTFTEHLKHEASLGFEVSLFNEPQHLMLQSSHGWTLFHAINNKLNRADIQLCIHLDDGIAKSPFKAPFGSVDFSDDVPVQTLFHFFEFVETRMKAKGAKSITLKNPPHDYNATKSALLEVFLINRGWKIAEAETGCMIALGERKDPSKWKTRKLEKVQQEELTFKMLPLEMLDEIYLFILASHKKKKYTLSMTLKDLREVVNTFPDRFFVSAAYHQNEMVGASISIQVNSEVLYNFYIDHDSNFDHIRPVAFIIQRLCDFASEKKFKWFDLGTSAIDGKPNFGLLHFKMRLGGTPTAKLSFVKELH